MYTTINAVSKFSTAKNKINGLLARQTITSADMEGFSRAEMNLFQDIVNERLAGLKGEERNNFLAKLDPLLPESSRHAVWEYNHQIISDAISTYIKKYSLMPRKETIAEQTGLSRQTVTKHFNEYGQHPMFTAEAEQFKFMSNKVLATVLKFADNGDIRAAKLYFEMVGTSNKQQSATVVTEQNNYIQINNTVLSQQNLKQLSAEQLNQIEGIINSRQPEILSLEAKVRS